MSIIIPCRNGESSLGKQLDALLAQETDASFEVIVADNGSVDDTADIVAAYQRQDPRVRLADASRSTGANVARNVGVAAARGTVVLLTDADDLVHPGWVRAYWVAFQTGAHCAGGGLNRVLADGTVLATERRLYKSLVGKTQFANTTNCGFTLEAFEKAGGFDESFTAGADEIVFFWRLAQAGYRLQLVPDAVVDKLQHADLRDAYHQYFNFGRGEALLARKLRPAMMPLLVMLAALHTVASGLVWATLGRLPRLQRKTVCTLAFNLGMLSEGVRLSSHP